ncbi:PREDICTED: dual specificity tyrosine-phosphorylation-regulated kinase 4-like [Camelina sativa]|uniref:Dual specificity tyrosine-phosphorylation-regulated kinase 4-like n=1 Tax=Camelina sativa TaxID=90675 RepID=A0ABM0WPQ6_CAMSA|nr:PREDICTED: dual specificity tyrosine-phosphorylation-regulated kinase 4-like [Camelina sativa]
MTDQGSVDGILEFLRQNRFSKAEKALRNELNNRSDINGFLQKLKLEDKDSNEKAGGGNELLRRSGSRDSEEVSKELIVKEVDCGTSTNGSVIKWENGAASEKPSKKETAVSSGMSFTFSDDADAHSYKFTSGNGTLEPYRNIADNSVADSYAIEQSRHGNLADIDKKILMHAESSKSLWSGNRETATRDRKAERLNASTATDDMVATWRRKSSDSSSSRISVKENNATSIKSVNSSPSSLSNYACEERKHADKEDDRNDSSEREDDHGTALDDEEAVAVQEQVRQIKAQEKEFETFDLKIVHRKNRTGFEEEKNFHVVLNSVIAGRYHVTEYLGSAAFSKAIQAHDLQTGMDVCIKIIKNNKDFFDQSLDEIKLLKYVNKHDPADKYHLLRLYDYFYFREHLLIVCELLKANLYEFHKFNRESGGEVYFTMPRLQSITIQCLESLQFLHGLGLIHCDLKPENILVKSYSRCEIKVIDLGSSCFETDHLCSYVQSRSYRAPEVILGLPYDKKIDVWSLGCILAELCTGNVLFQNDSPASLLARVMGIVGSFDSEMLTKGRDSHKYFTKNRMLYERNQESNRLEYLIPKRTSLRHRLPMGDQGFTDFVAHLLEINPKKRPSAAEALKHPWLSYPYEPISA